MPLQRGVIDEKLPRREIDCCPAPRFIGVFIEAFNVDARAKGDTRTLRTPHRTTELRWWSSSVPRRTQAGSKQPSTPTRKSRLARVQADGFGGTRWRQSVPWKTATSPGRGARAWKSPRPGADSASSVVRVSATSVSGSQKLSSPGWWPYLASSWQATKRSLGPGWSRSVGGRC
jgi:hypothetical protein